MKMGFSPPPKDPKLRRRRNPTPGFRMLPHEGRSGDPPPWPLPPHPLPEYTKMELQKWADLWTLPQAFEWERMRCFDDVALYVRTFVAASMPAADPKIVTQVRQLDSKIGVSPKAMQDLRWETDEPLPEEEPEPEPKTGDNGKRRLIIDD